MSLQAKHLHKSCGIWESFCLYTHTHASRHQVAASKATLLAKAVARLCWRRYVTAFVAVQVMQGGAYVAALLRLCRHSSEAVIRRALKLITYQRCQA